MCRESVQFLSLSKGSGQTPGRPESLKVFSRVSEWAGWGNCHCIAPGLQGRWSELPGFQGYWNTTWWDLAPKDTIYSWHSSTKVQRSWAEWERRFSVLPVLRLIELDLSYYTLTAQGVRNGSVPPLQSSLLLERTAEHTVLAISLSLFLHLCAGWWPSNTMTERPDCGLLLVFFFFSFPTKNWLSFNFAA